MRWEDPPPTRHTARAIWCRCAADLAQQPGVWACVLEAGTAVYARQSVARQLRKHGCEVATRTVSDDGLVGVWARWPEAQPSAHKGRSTPLKSHPYGSINDSPERASIVA